MLYSFQVQIIFELISLLLKNHNWPDKQVARNEWSDFDLKVLQKIRFLISESLIKLFFFEKDEPTKLEKHFLIQSYNIKMFSHFPNTITNFEKNQGKIFKGKGP